jgi:Arc/MetJ-type ribon-helix-helix transcriptional regulator
MRIPFWYAQCMAQIAVRLSEEALRTLDAAVAEGAFRSRADAVRAGIRLLERELREARIASSYRAAYAEMPLSAEETRVLDAALALAGDAPA